MSQPSLCGAFVAALAASLIGTSSAGADASTLPPPAQRVVDYPSDIEPLFRKFCYSCHAADAQEGGLRLDRKDRALQGGDGGPVIEPGSSAGSRLIQLVAGLDAQIGPMPPDGEGTPLEREQIALLRAWIDQGAAWPEEAEGGAVARHWSFRAVRDPSLPAAAEASWVRGSLDAFILRRLQATGLSPASPASRETLIRRLYLDLLGLLPAPEEVQSFLEDASPRAYELLVERLLASPHFGERWGRHWLDLARYADSDGYEKDRGRPHAWRYRHWVISALNADLPYDRFSLAQIAGDLLPEATLEQRIASGFHRNTLHNTEGGTDPEEDRVKKTVDRTNTVGTIWLGLTVGCAECHSHKYDPLSQREYYSLYAFFNDLEETEIAAPLPDGPGSGGDSEGVKAQAVARVKEPRTTRIHIRGDFLNPGAPVSAATPEFLPSLDRADPDRLDFARWLVHPENPLTARVAANRIWQRIFGRGIVSTIDDFGRQGASPTHPELLDWLATELIRGQWSFKALIRTIVLSATYRQSSAYRPELRAVDPENILWARQNRRRVEAEVIRDLALVASGQLDARIGGPSVRPPQPADYSALTYANSAKWEVSTQGDAYRRGLYTFFQRTSPYPMLMTFDSPDSTLCCAQRSSSNTPLQALTLWNDLVFYQCAAHLGSRVVRELPPESSDLPAARIRHAFRLCLSRAAAAVEVQAMAELYASQVALLAGSPASAAEMVQGVPRPEGISDAELAGWISVSRTLLNLDEFITRE